MIAIDAGHGGPDRGGAANGVLEKHIALVYAMSLGGELCTLGVPVIQTRRTDALPGGGDVNDALLERARIANIANARAFISVHFNMSDNMGASGIWLIHANGAPGGKALAVAIQRELGGAVFPDQSPQVDGRRLAVLRRTRMPAVLIEYGFLSNPVERARVRDVEYMRTLVAQTARGIKAWLG